MTDNNFSGDKKFPMKTLLADYLTNSDNKALPKFQVAVLVYVIILTFPSLIVDIGGDIDSSAFIGLHKAANEGLVYGKDIVFTYGPLGFLNIPLFITKSLWVCSAIYTLAVYAIAIISCSIYVRRMKANLAKTIIFAIIFVTVSTGWLNWPTGCDFKLLLSILIFSHLYTLSKKSPIQLSGLAFLYSILLFTKFSVGLMGVITGFVFLCILIKDKRKNEAIIFLVAFLVSFSALGLLLIGPPKVIFTYLHGCWEITTGYNDTLAIQAGYLKKYYLSAIFAWISYIGLFCYCAFKKRRLEIIFLSLIFGLLFSSYKLGFVRLDISHLIYFHSMWLLLFGLFFLRSFKDIKIAGYYILLFIFVIFCLCIANISELERASFPNLYMPNNIITKLENLQLSFNLFRGIGAEEQIAKVKMQLMQYFPLKTETVEMLSGHTMDVFPCDVAITEAYGFKWRPRPVFQSYIAYTEYLDSLNAKHFQSDSAPEYILYALSSLNARYAISDEPATFKTLLQEYEPCGQDAKFIILRKKHSPDMYMEKEIGTAVAKFDQIITFPKFNNELLFAKVYIENNLLGLAQKLLFKPPLDVRIKFYIPDKNEIVSYRLVCPNARNGIFISKIVEDQNDLLEIWKGDFRHDIAGLIFSNDHPKMFKDKITIRFFKMPANKIFE